MLLKKLAHIFIGLALLSLQAANGQSLVEAVGQFIPPNASSVDGKSIKSAIESEFLINFFEKLDSETFDSANPEICKSAKKIADRTSSTIAKGLKNSDLELTTKEKLFVCNQLKFMTTLLLRINGLSDQCKQDILKAHRLINAIFSPSFSARAFDFIYAQKNKAFTALGLIAATFGTLAAFHTFKILKTTDQVAQDIQKVSGLGASACQTACDNPENLAAGLGAGIDVLAAKDKELEKIIGAFKKSDKSDGASPIIPTPPSKGPFEMIEGLVNNPANHGLIERLATTLGSQAIKLGLAPKPDTTTSKRTPKRVVVGGRSLKPRVEPKQQKSPITEGFEALENNSRTRRRLFHTIETVGKHVVTEVAPEIPGAVAAYSSKAAPQPKAQAKEKEKAKEPSIEGDDFDSGDESSDAESTDSCRVDDDEESQRRPLGSSSSSSSTANAITKRKKKKVRFTAQQKVKDPQSMFSQITSELEKNPNTRAELIDAGKEVAKQAVKTSPQFATTIASAGLHATGTRLYNAGASTYSVIRHPVNTWRNWGKTSV